MSDEPRLVELHEPPQCCPGGVCSADALAALVDIHEALQRLSAEHGGRVRIQRYVFPRKLESIADLDRRQTLADWAANDLLPVTCVDGEVQKTHEYPSYDELLAFAGLAPAEG